MRTRSAQEIWEAALGELQIQVSKPNYRTWLERTIGLSYQGNQFVVGVPNPFAAEYLDRSQRTLIAKTLIGITRHDMQVVFQVNGRHPNSASGYSTLEEARLASQTTSVRLNPKYTFDSFIIGSCNHLAYSAALSVAQNLGLGYNPLFIYGGVGLGKTHLLHAIGHLALANNIQVIFVSGEQFTNEFINAIREKNTAAFRKKYRSADMLLIDDIHFIIGKEQTEESFFHTFNALHNANRQIVITSTRPPKSMSSLEERLRSRFEWGLIVDMQPPDFETRLLILQAKTKQVAVNVGPEVVEFIARQAFRNIRQLEGALNRVIAYARLTKETPTPRLAAKALEDIAFKEPKQASITTDLIIEAVADSFQLTPADLKSKKRKQSTVAREVAIYLIRQETNYSLSQIGTELGGRDPSFVSRAYTKIASNINTNPHLQRKISDIQQRLRTKQKSSKRSSATIPI